jgi:energy-coupling factor transport system permease protein
MISVTTVLTATTKPLDLTYGLEFFMTPLKVIKFPAHEIAMTISIALRFIPTILEETQKIMKAQASRGVDLQEGSLKEKISAIISLIIPLFISAFQRSEELANAMEARGYNPSAKRTRYRTLKFTMKDVFSLLVSILVLGVCITFSNFPNLLEQLLGWSNLF